MQIEDLEYCFKEQLDNGATAQFHYMLEDVQNRTPHRVEKMTHRGPLAGLLPFLDTCVYVKKLNNMPKFRIE